MAMTSFENSVSFPNDKIVRRLDQFPDLVQALRDGDLLTGRLFCAQLFDANPWHGVGHTALEGRSRGLAKAASAI